MLIARSRHHCALDKVAALLHNVQVLHPHAVQSPVVERLLTADEGDQLTRVALEVRH